jgi:hypothetical protein
LGVCGRGYGYYLRQVLMEKSKFTSYVSKICRHHSSVAQHSHLLVRDNVFWASTCQWVRGLYCLWEARYLFQNCKVFLLFLFIWCEDMLF